jgi:hypothetical protein
LQGLGVHTLHLQELDSPKSGGENDQADNAENNPVSH